MENEKEFLCRLLRRVTEDEGFTDDPEISIQSGSGIGDGFLSNNSAVEIRSGNKTMKLFVKASTKNATIRNQIQTENLFGREIYFYETVYPSFLKFQGERNVKRKFDNAPRCYLTSTEDTREILIFENLKAQGFELYNKRVEDNDQIITSVFKLYASFHAVSFAMKDQAPEEFAKLTGSMEDITWTFFKTAGIDVAFTQSCEDARAIFDSIGDPQISSRIQNLTQTLMNTVSNSSQSVDDYSVITHGDSWYNNFLFKYKTSGFGLDDVKILDWQIMRVNSPVMDLAYFFYAIATKSNLDRLDFYLKTYHDALFESMVEMGSDPVMLYPFDVFMGHWKKFCKFGLLMSLAIQKATLMEKEEMPNPVEAVNSGKKFGDAFKMPVIGNEDLYKERIRDIMRHFVCNDFI